ncbi:hypothetical protein EDD66_108131 [Mobilisporobacter senegalensis]|uniref:Epoxyqueuosine reductase QueH n=1 Tax=Mobilisporobacter senegalensis TaxID=1329262 RepID=A0A3N1XI72_9FIRM|nr:epoxyqueuosine reductase QueH [Mobilisporobacter senegalensis]ROR26409.1 hypothetical protein EDD66_108131 [Mobilisporobacter senegalensis]
MNINYQKELDKLIEGLEKSGTVPTLLLHSCCAPCSSYCIEYLSNYFHITIFYYNPNISPKEEYDRRVEEQKMLIRKMNTKYPVKFMEGIYEPDKFYAMAKGKEQLPEGGERCYSCYKLRLEEAAKIAEELQFDYFTTSLSISPMKDAAKLNGIGDELSVIYKVSYLNSDFKKKNGYKRSVELSKEYDLYRQDFCGCVYSRRDRRNS